MNKIAEFIIELVKDTVQELGCELWDVEYIKEGGQRYLRVYIDKPDGVSIVDCEAVSRAIDVLLDEKDPIPDSYIFEVSSAGAERELKRPADYERFIGSNVEVRLYVSDGGRKTHIGRLLSYENGDVSIETAKGELTFNKNSIAQVRLSIT